MLFFFASTLFVSATLLFLVQPMIGKMVLPRLGGTPAVWNTCMVFFQGVLLLGYLYTHILSVRQSRRTQLVAQFAILALPFLVLPFTLGSWNPPGDSNPIWSVLWLLLGMVGLPFFVVATSAPLLQRWFATTNHPAAKDPYFLYGASNLGSMLALLLYPVVVEPNFPLDSQTILWTACYGVLLVMVVVCGLLVWKQKEDSVPILALAEAAPPVPAKAPVELATAITGSKRLGRHRGMAPVSRQKITPQSGADVNLAVGEMTWGRRFRWIGLAAAPTSLMLGVTTYLTTDISAIPFIWIIPLALYLLTFILVFARWPVRWVGTPHTVLLYVQPFVLLFLLLVVYARMGFPIWIYFILHLLMFFSTALVCHGELAKNRPPARHLTDFYLCMSVGGVLGGMFNALVAPVLFKWGVAEYYVAIVVACCLRPSMLGSYPLIPGDSTKEESTPVGWILNIVIPVAMGFLGYYLARLEYVLLPVWFRMAVGFVLVLVLVQALEGRSFRFGMSLGLMILGIDVHSRIRDPLLFEDRSFFGFVKVRSYQTETTKYHTLVHGGINHGSQIIEPESRRRDTITYFHPTGGIGQVFKDFSWPDARLPASLVGLGAMPGGLVAGYHSEPPYAVVGLGTGILAAHAKPGQHVVFYEIDPLVKRLSVPPKGADPYFTYIQDARDRGANLEIILGDGRLTLQKDPMANPLDPKTNRMLDRYYHIIVLDAFSSDAIPIHLLTAEAIDLYLDKLAEGGVLVFNCTNRYVDLRPELGKIAKEKGLTCLYYGDYEYEVLIDENGQRKQGRSITDKFGSDWVVVQRKNYDKERRAANAGPALEQRLNMLLWKPADIEDGPMWTDNYSNLLRALHLWPHYDD